MTHQCPACGGDEAWEIGVLGILRWFRCRSCGMTSCEPADRDVEPYELEEERP